VKRALTRLFVVALLGCVSAKPQDDGSYTHEATRLSFPKHAADLVRDEPETGNPPGSVGLMYRRAGATVLLVVIMPVRPDQASEPSNVVAAMLGIDRIRGLPAREVATGHVDATCDETSSPFSYVLSEGPTGPEARFATKLRGHLVYIRCSRDPSPSNSIPGLLESILTNLRFPCHAAAA